MIAGLLLVTYELRQNRQIARAELNSQQLVQMGSISGAFRDPVFAAVFQKSLVEPESLTPDERLMIDGHFRDLINLVRRDRSMTVLGVFEDNTDFWAAYVVMHGLGTEFGRQWWSQNKDTGALGGVAPSIDEALEKVSNGEFQVVY